MSKKKIEDAEAVVVVETAEAEQPRQKQKEKDFTDEVKGFVNGFGIVNLLACASIAFALIRYFVLIFTPFGAVWPYYAFAIPAFLCFGAALGFYVYQCVSHKTETKFNLNVLLILIALVFMILV